MKKRELVGRSKGMLLFMTGLMTLAVVTVVTGYVDPEPYPQPTADLCPEEIPIGEATYFTYNLNDLDGGMSSAIWDTIQGAVVWAYTGNLKTLGNSDVNGDQVTRMFEAENPHGSCWVRCTANDGGNPDGADDSGDGYPKEALGVVILAG